MDEGKIEIQTLPRAYSYPSDNPSYLTREEKQAVHDYYADRQQHEDNARKRRFGQPW